MKSEISYDYYCKVTEMNGPQWVEQLQNDGIVVELGPITLLYSVVCKPEISHERFRIVKYEKTEKFSLCDVEGSLKLTNRSVPKLVDACTVCLYMWEDWMKPLGLDSLYVLHQPYCDARMYITETKKARTLSLFCEKPNSPIFTSKTGFVCLW